MLRIESRTEATRAEKVRRIKNHAEKSRLQNAANVMNINGHVAVFRTNFFECPQCGRENPKYRCNCDIIL